MGTLAQTWMRMPSFRRVPGFSISHPLFEKVKNSPVQIYFRLHIYKTFSECCKSPSFGKLNRAIYLVILILN